MSEVRSCPGLVSAHSHAFQRAIRGRTEQPSGVGQDTFWTWREAMYQAANRLSPEDIYDVSRMTFLEMALAGITAVGEFHYLHNAPDGTRYDDSNLLAKQVIRAATDVGLRIVLLNTAYVRGGQPRFLTPSIDDFIRDTEDLRGCSTELVSIGVAPHSVRAVPLDYLRGVAQGPAWKSSRHRLVALHHHVVPLPHGVGRGAPTEIGMRLDDSKAVAEVFDELGVTLVLHGHRHVSEQRQPAGSNFRILASPSLTLGCRSGDVPSYWRIELGDHAHVTRARIPVAAIDQQADPSEE